MNQKKAEASLPLQPFPNLHSQYACRGFLNANETIQATLSISFRLTQNICQVKE